MPAPTTITTLKKRSDFLAAAASGRKWVAPGFILQIGKPSETASSSPVRFGLTASAKVGNAVARNRARRRLRALAHEILAAHADPACAYVLVARKDATASRAYAAMRDDMEKALRRFGLWRSA